MYHSARDAAIVCGGVDREALKVRMRMHQAFHATARLHKSQVYRKGLAIYIASLNLRANEC